MKPEIILITSEWTVLVTIPENYAQTGFHRNSFTLSKYNLHILFTNIKVYYEIRNFWYMS